jgi:hypothetical protein
MRTFVISDAHGCPELIQNALRHGGFEPGADGFVYAGDLLDRGPDAKGCIAFVERYATEVLLGNHDVAAVFDLDVCPQAPESPALGPLLAERVLSSDSSTAWKAAACVEGALITHAGVSEEYQRTFLVDCRSDPTRLACRLNDGFRDLVARKSHYRDWSDHELLGSTGPFWFRPWPYSYLRPLFGCVQVVGHTPPLEGLDCAGVSMIDPTSWEEWADPARFRYAIIEAGAVRVYAGTLAVGDSALAPEEPSSALCA